MEVSISGTTVRWKCTRKEKAILQNKILTHNIVIERGVVQSDLLVEPFRFIYDIFHNNQWTSLFTLVDAYPRLVWEFYFNIESIKSTCDLSFKTKVLGKTLTINSKLISEVTGIPLTNGKAAPFLHIELQSSKADIMAVLILVGSLNGMTTSPKFLLVMCVL